MSEQYVHGVRVITLDDGPRPIQTVSTSVIGVIGTAPNADASKFPLDTPVLISGSRKEAAKLKDTGTLPQAMEAIFDQCNAAVVVIRVKHDDDAAITISNVIGGVDEETQKYTGAHAFLSSKNLLHVKPKILCAPSFDHKEVVTSKLLSIADTLRATVYASGPNVTDKEAKAFKEKFNSRRLYICDPWVNVWDTKTNNYITQPPSARLAGLRAKLDNEKGFWHSISNNVLNGVHSTSRVIDFELGDPNSRANLLNAAHIGTIIIDGGVRCYGSRNCSTDTKYMYESVSRTLDIINDTIQSAHLWAVDKGIAGAEYFAEVVESVNAYLRRLRSIGAIVNGECWVDPELNTPANIQQGKVYFDFDFTPVYPAETLTFRSRLTHEYLEEIF